MENEATVSKNFIEQIIEKDLAQEWERREEERTRRLVVAFEKSYQQRASVQ